MTDIFLPEFGLLVDRISIHKDKVLVDHVLTEENGLLVDQISIDGNKVLVDQVPTEENVGITRKLLL